MSKYLKTEHPFSGLAPKRMKIIGQIGSELIVYDINSVIEKDGDSKPIEDPVNPEKPEVETQPNDEIWYTTTTHKRFGDNGFGEFVPSFEDFNANLVSDTYDATADKGILKFDRDVTIWDCGAWEWDNVYYVDTISLPASLTQFGSYGYIHRWPITSIKFLSETPLDTGGIAITDKIDAMYDELVIYVPENSVEAYKTAWPEISDRIQPIK